MKLRKIILLIITIFIFFILIVIFFRLYQFYEISGTSIDGKGADIAATRRYCFFQANVKDFVHVKRVIALPDETVETRNSRVLIDGKGLSESYLPD